MMEVSEVLIGEPLRRDVRLISRLPHHLEFAGHTPTISISIHT